MKNLSLKKKALLTFIIMSILFVCMVILASRVYIAAIAKSYTTEHESNNAFIGYEFGKIIRFYAETDPEKLLNSELLQLYTHLEDETFLAVLKDGEIIFGKTFYENFVTNPTEQSAQQLQDAEIEFDDYPIENAAATTITLVSLSKVSEPEKPDPLPFKKVDQYATIAFSVYLVVLMIMFTLFLNRILKPLEEVKRAAVEIKNGNLDFQITHRANDEIGEVYRAIEEMRGELKASAELRAQYDRNRNELLSNITHDLKTPITSIKGYVEGIVDGVAGTPEKIQKYAKTIYKHTVEMDSLINDLFLMSKLDIDQIDFKYEPLEIVDFLKDCYDDYDFELSAKGILFTFENALSKPFFIQGDRQNLKRVMVNLLQNSIKHLDKEPPVIKISVHEVKGGILIRLRDNGKGIPAAERQHIFDRFYRVDDSRNSDSGGSGIGLSIVKKIVEKHKGTIVAESEFGQWTEMCIYFPEAKENI